jgi:hypothetical protein
MQCLFGVYIVYFQLFICLKCCFAKSSNFGQIRIKRALLYQLSYELDQGRCFKTITGTGWPHRGPGGAAREGRELLRRAAGAEPQAEARARAPRISETVTIIFTEG